MISFEVKIHKKSDGSFQTKFLDPKTGSRKRKLFPTLKEAKLYKTEVENSLQNKGLSAFSDLRISQAMKTYIEKFPNSGVRERKNQFHSFIETFGTHRVSEFTGTDLRTWFESRKKFGNLSELTLNRIRCQFFGFFEFLVEEGHVPENLLKKIKFKRYDNPRRARVVLSVEEVREVLENAKTFDPKTLYPYLYALANTGARRSEILNLQREDIDFNLRLVHLKYTKNGHPRFIKMSPKLVDVLKEKLDSHEHPWVFENEFGKQLHRSELARLIDKFNAYFPMEKEWTCHSLRHSFAYNFLKAGGEMYQLQAILGHRGIQVTVDLYGQLKSQDIENPSPYNF